MIEDYADTLPAAERSRVLHRHYRDNRAGSSEEAAARLERLAAVADEAAKEEVCPREAELWGRQATMLRGWARRVRSPDPALREIQAQAMAADLKGDE